MEPGAGSARDPLADQQSATVTHMGVDEVSVRELRQNLSVYLRRVREGTTLAVTSRGERVAVLAPITGASRLDHLIAERRVTPPTQAWSDPEPLPPEDDARETPTDALLAMRDDDGR